HRRGRVRYAERDDHGARASEEDVLTGAGPRRAALGVALLAACVLTSPLAAQTVELWVQADAAHARPPAGVPALEATSLGLFGARLHLDRAGALDLDLSLFGGRGATPADGVWFDGAVGAGTVWRTGRYAGDRKSVVEGKRGDRGGGRGGNDR